MMRPTASASMNEKPPPSCRPQDRRTAFFDFSTAAAACSGVGLSGSAPISFSAFFSSFEHLFTLVRQ